MIGKVVGNFEILSQLGRGGMGEVWLAQQQTLKTKAAIKILAAEISNNTQHVARFHNEAIAVSQIPHAGIVKIFDAGMIEGRAYLVMEYLEGETLASRIARESRLELVQLCDFGRQIASVLDATHRAGITHRDLKPDNIFLVRDAEMVHGERVKVLDFGIAKLDTTVGPRMTAASASSIGTPNYMSPEQWHSLADADWRTDAYALGCVAFEMACGRPPFVAQTRVEVCAMHLDTPPPVPSSLRPALPPPFDRLVARLLDKDPANRPSMREVIGVFAALGEQAGVVLSTIPPQAAPHDASGSFAFKMTPRAFASQTDLPIVGTSERPDATPVADMSLQFRATPRAGFPSQTDLPAMTPERLRGASQGMTMKAAPRRSIGLWVALAAVVTAAVVIALVALRSAPSPHDQPGVVDAGSTVALSDGGTPPDASPLDAPAIVDAATAPPPPPPSPPLPPRREPAQLPDLAQPLDVVVCIDAAGEVTDVRLPSGAPPDNAVEAKVLTWSYRPTGADQCGPVTIPAKAAAVGLLPERFTQKLFDNAVGAVHQAIFDCAELGSGTFTIEVTVSPAGVGKISKLALPTANRKFEKCIRAAVSRAPFAKTRLGGKGKTTVQLGG